MDGVTFYIDGVSTASTAFNKARYVAMQDLATNVLLGSNFGAGGGVDNPLDGKMAGGPLGPFFTQIELDAAQVEQLYDLGRAAMDLPP